MQTNYLIMHDIPPKYRIVQVSQSSRKSANPNILIIYTGGTIGMVHDDSGSLISLNFHQIMRYVPDLKNLGINLTVISFPEPIDSSNICIRDWQNIGFIIHENYRYYDGFVILHGTDTLTLKKA